MSYSPCVWSAHRIFSLTLLVDLHSPSFSPEDMALPFPPTALSSVLTWKIFGPTSTNDGQCSDVNQRVIRASYHPMTGQTSGRRRQINGSSAAESKCKSNSQDHQCSRSSGFDELFDAIVNPVDLNLWLDYDRKKIVRRSTDRTTTAPGGTHMAYGLVD